jgi:hypothetical protein
MPAREIVVIGASAGGVLASLHEAQVRAAEDAATPSEAVHGGRERHGGP